jgi:hypothetical protein
MRAAVFWIMRQSLTVKSHEISRRELLRRFEMNVANQSSNRLQLQITGPFAKPAAQYLTLLITISLIT